MQAIIEVTAQITVDFNQGKMMLQETDLQLGVSDNINSNDLFDENDFPNKKGCELLTTALIAGLNGNIHMAHHCGYRDSAEHLRFVITQLEEMFVLNPVIEYAEKEVNHG